MDIYVNIARGKWVHYSLGLNLFKNITKDWRTTIVGTVRSKHCVGTERDTCVSGMC